MVREAVGLLAQMRTLQLATLCEDNRPLASYAPYVHANGALYVYLSELAAHARNLRDRPTVCAMLIHDEAQCEEIFARPRLTLDCTVVEQARDGLVFSSVLDLFESRYGETASTIRALTDFRLFELRPHQARVVSGFAKASEIYPDALNDILGNVEP
jgi:putative heme iron utilization protein